MTDHAPALEITGLRFRFPGAAEETIRLDALQLARGEQMLLTGSSGRGKSTLLNLIAGLIEPTAGTIRVDGRDVHAMSGAKRDLFRGATIGMVFQTFHLLHGFSAAENVMAALMFSPVPRREHRTRAEELLRTVGIETPDRDCGSLSIGQQQRVAVARAAAVSPVIVLADEPTASLDPASAEIAMDLLQSTCREIGAALLCTSHDPRMAARFERREALGLPAAPAREG
ncbi:MAG: ATP-binding cassette domain-containing protein [Phycisphaerales bacterium]